MYVLVTGYSIPLWLLPSLLFSYFMELAPVAFNIDRCRGRGGVKGASPPSSGQI